MDKKNQHILAINHILAEFDIETQVKKITLETLDAYMRGNKQAFQFIKESQTKFIDFEARVCKAQTYYQNLEVNINSKIEVTNLLNERLEKFSERFWQGMKQTTESVEQMRKNFLNLTRQAGNQGNLLTSQQKQIEHLTSKIDKLQLKINSQVSDMLEKLNQSEQKTQKKIFERKREAEDVLLKVAEAKSLLSSKTELLSNLLKDISLYKEEKKTINSQIDSIHQELNNRIVKAEFYEFKKYVDNVNLIEKERVNVQVKDLHLRVQKEEKKRQFQDQKVMKEIKTTNQLLQREFKDVRNVAEKNLNLLKEDIKRLDEKTQRNFKEEGKKIEENKNHIQKVEDALKLVDERVYVLEADVAHKTNQIQQIESNIHSMNTLISGIEQQNLLRAESLSKLQLNAEETGDIGEQMRKFSEKVMAMDEVMRNHTSQIENNKQESDTFTENVNNTLANLERNLNFLSEKEEKEVNELRVLLKEECAQLDTKVDQKHEEALETAARNLKEKMDTFQDKFDFLERVNTEISAFKDKFEKQLKVNETLNLEIKQKMEKMSSMITKLKADFFIKLQALNQEHLKSVQKIKSSKQTIESICKLLTEMNESLTICLAGALWRETIEEKGNCKIASILEGWVIEVDEKEKIRYRGEYLSRRVLYQLALEHFVKMGDKIKGGIIEQGKQIFHKMISNSDEVYSRKRPVSRGRKSQLPKLYR